MVMQLDLEQQERLASLLRAHYSELRGGCMKALPIMIFPWHRAVTNARLDEIVQICQVPPGQSLSERQVLVTTLNLLLIMGNGVKGFEELEAKKQEILETAAKKVHSSDSATRVNSMASLVTFAVQAYWDTWRAEVVS